MKIYITGPSGSGKTTLARKIATAHGIPHAELDYILTRRLPHKKKERVPTSEWAEMLDNFMSRDSWIIEGCNALHDVMERAEHIIFIHPKWYISLYRQWKRYFTDPIQRQTYGLRTNLKLSIFILYQHFMKLNKKHLDNVYHVQVCKTKLALAPHEHKTIYVMNNRDYKHAEELFTRQA